MKPKLATLLQKFVHQFAWLFFLCVAFALAGCGPYSPFLWLTAPREEIHILVPDGYQGRVLIAWQVPDGVVAGKEGEAWVYRLEEDGSLLLQNDPPEHILRMGFWYEKADGTRGRILDSTCFDSAAEVGVVVCTGMQLVIHNTFKLRPNMNFTITTLEDYLNRKWDTHDEYFRLTDKYLEELKLPEQE